MLLGRNGDDGKTAGLLPLLRPGEDRPQLCGGGGGDGGLAAQLTRLLVAPATAVLHCS